MPSTQELQVQIQADGSVPEDAANLAVLRLKAVLRQAPEPVLFARVKLSVATDPAVQRPALAQANIDLNGRPIRAQATGRTMREAIERTCDRLGVQLERSARNWAAIRGRIPVDEPGEWRHLSRQSRRTERLPSSSRPPEDRRVIRHKSYGLSRMTPDEAVADLELLDYDFHLFTERATGEDSVVYRADDGYRLAQVHPRPGRLGPLPTSIALSEVPAPRFDLTAAQARLETLGGRCLIYVKNETGRGNLIYHRFDGHYGLITPASS